MRMRLAIVGLLVLAAGACAPLSGSTACAPGACVTQPGVQPSITDVDIRATAQGARITVVSDQPLDPDVFWLAEGGDRLVLDFDRVKWALPGRAIGANQRQGDGAGVVFRYRFAHFSHDTSRLVFDLAGPALPRSTEQRRQRMRQDRYEFVVDLVEAPRQRFADTAGYTQRRVTASAAPAQRANRSPRDLLQQGGAQRGPVTLTPSQPARHQGVVSGRGDFVVVIDAGHGGRDSGAVSASGIREKDVNLAIARLLRDELTQRRQYRVVMTRNDDTSLTPEERLVLARNHQANLFISLHADSLSNSSAVRGASVYTLADRAISRSRAETVGRHDWIIGVDNLQSRPEPVSEILIDMTQSHSLNRSEYMADLIINQLREVGPMLRNTHRRAGFYVLLAPDVPAILVETGFLSNARDAQRIANRREQRRIAQALASAVNIYYVNTTGRSGG